MTRDNIGMIDIIYNLTRICPWDCAVCCVDAIQVSRKGRGEFTIRSSGLATSRTYDASGNIFAQAHEQIHKDGTELDFAGKLKVLEHLGNLNVKLDISGGDPLVVPENMEFLRVASRRLGRERITLTATGWGLRHVDTSELAGLISEFNFTFDAASITDAVSRPAGYANSNLAVAKRLKKSGCKTRAEFPLQKANISPEHLERLYRSLHESDVDELLIMRLFPVGRGALLQQNVPSNDQYIQSIAFLQALEKQYGRPRLKIQCALKHLMQRGATNPCDLVRESFGLMADGTLLASAWAIDAVGKPLSDDWVLGNLSESTLQSILASDRTRNIDRRADENFGHCKIFAFMHSRKQGVDRLLDRTDPLYALKPQETQPD